MLEILRSMIKEEWRIHSSLFGGLMFALFPIILLIIAFAGSLTLPFMSNIIPIQQLFVIFQYLFVLFGVSIGSFGLFGKEVMNRRFGQASLLAYSSRTLPVSEKKIFSNFVIKDIIYYFVLWVLPFVLGFAFASFFISLSIVYALSLLLIFTFSFLMGLSVIFLLSTIYAHSSKALVLVLVALVGLVAVYSLGANLSVLPAFSLFPTVNQIAISLVVIILPTALSLYFLKVDYPQKRRLFKNSLNKLSKLFNFSRYSTFISKDFIDFNRSEGGLGKIIFSFLLPIAFIWFIISVFLKIIPILNPFVIFSIFLGILSSSFYNWFTEFDTFNSYAFLPVRVSTLMKSKVNSFMIINLVSLLILTLVTLWTNQIAYSLPALFSFLALSAYSLSITTYLTGLNPNILLYNANIFAEYLLLLSPLLLIFIFSSAFNPFLLISGVVLIPVSYLIVKKSYEKWDNIEQPHF